MFAVRTLQMSIDWIEVKQISIVVFLSLPNIPFFPLSMLDARQRFKVLTRSFESIK